MSLAAARARTLEVAKRLGTEAREYDRQGGYRDRAGPGPVQRALSDGRVSSVNVETLDELISRARRDFANYSDLSTNTAEVTAERTTYPHMVVHEDSTGHFYQTQAPGVTPTASQVAAVQAGYGAAAERAKTALGALVDVRAAVADQLEEQSRLANTWEYLKDIVNDSTDIAGGGM